MNFKSLFQELKRRNIYKVAVAYGVTGWVIVQMGSIAANTFGAPAWVMKMLITTILLGFPIALIFAWAFEITPEGLKRTRKVAKGESITQQTGQKLNYWIIGFLSVAVVVLLVDRFWVKGSPATPSFSNEAKVVPTVAVLPFQNFSSGGDQEWFSDGLTEELLNSLARLQGLQVAARTSSFQFKNKNIPIRQIADSLGVEHVVEGSVRRADSTMRITAQLIRASDGFHEWSKTYERSTDDVFSVQEDISENIASVLDIYLDEEAREKMFAFGTRDVEAYNAYLKGRNAYDKMHQTNTADSLLFTRAIPMFRKAVQLDPDFAAPYYFMADPYTHYILDYPELKIDSLNPAKARERILANFDEAITHTSDSGQRLMFRLERTFLSDDWSDIPRLVGQLKNTPEAQRAYVQIGGGWTASFLTVIGHARLQHKLNREALERDPLSTTLKRSNLNSLLSFAPADTVFSMMDSYEDELNYLANVGNRFIIHLYKNNLAAADSIAALVTKEVEVPELHPFNILLEGYRGNEKNVRNALAKVSEYSFYDRLNSAIVHYPLGNHKQATALAMRVDTTTFGAQKLLLDTAVNNGGFLPFIVDSLSNISTILKQADVEIEPYSLGEMQLPRIVQQEL